ncbi:uncharacterized protein PHACADRAFT_203241 [Phanerochaete carnosa HHB-10118-sp]|uniref:Uncharacterized protein n=1 Tax=Phanerochaete carnosa (strain HHB-10118-sp) TaxID=650164 RepID=K5UF82_PHACS|nr:uncharacterized protein PHACADRAFT_203241 [Phanerochaete carnosa HHB-10118-sp]EKM48111.1 hypothetical protein PHACADRAFT_203241 [Phanerochaete carnosa HHB-10118-sp]
MELDYGNPEPSSSAKVDDARQGPAAEKWPAGKFGPYLTKMGRPTIEGSGYSTNKFNESDPEPTESEPKDATPAQKNLWRARDLKRRKRNEQRAAVLTKPLAITPWEQGMNHAKYALNVIKRYKGEYFAIRNSSHWNNCKSRKWMRWGYYANHHIKYLDEQRKLHEHGGIPAGISILPWNDRSVPPFVPPVWPHMDHPDSDARSVLAPPALTAAPVSADVLPAPAHTRGTLFQHTPASVHSEPNPPGPRGRLIWVSGSALILGGGGAKEHRTCLAHYNPYPYHAQTMSQGSTFSAMTSRAQRKSHLSINFTFCMMRPKLIASAWKPINGHNS